MITDLPTYPTYWGHFRSFALKAAKKQDANRNIPLIDLPVEEFMEDFPYVAANEDWTKIQRQLEEKDGFFVGHREEIDGLVTAMDVYNYFRKIADPFILIAEIEVSLRRIMAGRIPKQEQSEIFGHVLQGAYPEGKTPTRARDLTLTDLVLIILSRDYYHYFQEIFGKEGRSGSCQRCGANRHPAVAPKIDGRQEDDPPTNCRREFSGRRGFIHLATERHRIEPDELYDRLAR